MVRGGDNADEGWRQVSVRLLPSVAIAQQIFAEAQEHLRRFLRKPSIYSLVNIPGGILILEWS